MFDISLQWGGDLQADSSGDLAVSLGSDTVSQRVFRRLLTNPGAYIWNLDYGGGLPQFVGSPANPANIEAVVRAQLELEAAVPTLPEPQIEATIADAARGIVLTTIRYTDPSSPVPVQITVPTGQ